MNDLSLNSTLRNLIYETGLPLKKFSEYSELGPHETLKLWNREPVSLNMRHVKNLALRLGISEGDILKGSYDIDLIRKRMFQGPMKLPAKYETNALSFTRSSAHIVECASLLLGRQVADDILLKMNVVPTFLQDLDKRISLTFFMDLLDEVAKFGIVDYDLLSRAMFLTLEDTELGQKFRQARTYEEFYSILDQSTSFFDQNFQYCFSISGRGMDLVTFPSEMYLDGSEGNPMNSQRLFAYREKLFGCMPVLSGLPPLKLTKLSCISQGDVMSHYTVAYPNLSRLQ